MLCLALLSLYSSLTQAFPLAYLASQSGLRNHLNSLPSSSLITSVEFFDGSQVVDPIIVSGVFWSSLKTRFISLIIGQILSTIFFGILVTITASQLAILRDWISSKLGDRLENRANVVPIGKRFMKADEFTYRSVAEDMICSPNQVPHDCNLFIFQL